MKGITCKKTRKLVNESIARQEKWKEEQEKWKEEYEKARAEFKKGMEQLRKDLGRLGNSYGEQIESMFVNLDKKFDELGFDFPKQSGRTTIKENGKVLVEVDSLMENGSAIMSVEVKSKFKIDYVDDHIERLGILSEYYRKQGDTRKVLGAVAGGIMPENVLKYAHRKGLYVLVQNGESISLAALPADFAPREW